MSEKKIIQTPSLFAVDDSFEDERFMKVRIKVFSSGVVARGHNIRFTRACLENSKDTFFNIPILANVVVIKDKDGNETLDYGGHDWHVESDQFNEGEDRIIYDEKVVGIIDENTEFELVENGDDDNIDLFVTGFIFKDYGGYAVDILKSRNGETSVSAEVDCQEMSANETDGVLEVGKIQMWGITLLGEDVEPAIPDANCQMFSIKEDDRQEQLMSIMQELKASLDNYTEAVNAAQNLKEGGEAQMNNEHFEALLAQYNKTAEDVTFEYENLSDEELDKAFAEAFSASEPEAQEDCIELAIKRGNDVKLFSVSLRDKMSALAECVNASYGDEDWFDVDVFENPDYVVMHGWTTRKHFKQSYTSENDVAQLSGERIEVFEHYLTKEEEDELNNKLSDYDAMSDELDKFKSEPEKAKVLESEDYEVIRETEEYASLLNDHSDISVEELTAKLDSILLEQTKKQNREILSAKKPAVGGKLFPGVGNVSAGRYGGIFAND